MHGDADLAEPARLMGEPARAAMLVALLDGRSLPASELAGVAGVSASTASTHLAQLLAGRLVTDRRLGRHRYFTLASAEVANAVEALQLIAPRREVSSYSQSATAERLALARSCYDHLAGRLALDLADALVRDGAIAPLVAGEPGRVLDPATPLARRFGITGGVGAAGGSTRRPLLRGCLDWTERRPHIAGRLGAHVLEHVITEGWIERRRGDRSLRVTEAGSRKFAELARD
ncbi:ArsR/SmtB family transcription factor [Agromyces sp. CCNWLW203]|uniref:ArsR/SmtB family transcription factor n=1 Tax=Agromyces sp. CCNWLW203 TaxID=3112842 RepID=UPI002F968816